MNVTKPAKDMVKVTQNYQMAISISVNILKEKMIKNYCRISVISIDFLSFEKARKMARVHTNFVVELDILVSIIKTRNMAKVSSTIQTAQSMMVTGKPTVRNGSKFLENFEVFLKSS